MTHMSVYGGLFSDPPLISTDADPSKTDPYNKMDTIPSRYLGKGINIGVCPQGRGPEVFFDKKFLTLASAEQNGGKDVGAFEDFASRTRREAMDSKKKNIADKEFLPPSYPKWSDGPGSYSGCFQSRPYEFIRPGEERGKSKRKHKAAAEASDSPRQVLPNIKTARTKKGTYGYPGLLLDNVKYNDNWREELEQWKTEEAKRNKKKSPPLKEIGPPFKTLGVTHDFLDELPSTGVSGIYHYEPRPEKPSKRRNRSRKPAAAAAVFTQEKPMSFTWTKVGEPGSIAPFPNTWIDPAALEEAKKGKQRRRRRKQPPAFVPCPPKGANGIWRPNSFPDTTIVQSCLRRFY